LILSFLVAEESEMQTYIPWSRCPKLQRGNWKNSL